MRRTRVRADIEEQMWNTIENWERKVVKRACEIIKIDVWTSTDRKST